MQRRVSLYNFAQILWHMSACMHYMQDTCACCCAEVTCACMRSYENLYNFAQFYGTCPHACMHARHMWYHLGVLLCWSYMCMQGSYAEKLWEFIQLSTIFVAHVRITHFIEEGHIVVKSNVLAGEQWMLLCQFIQHCNFFFLFQRHAGELLQLTS